MEHKSNNKTASIALIICGILEIIFGVILHEISDVSTLEIIAYGYDSDSLSILSIFSVLLFLFGVYSIVMGIVKGVKASHESNVDTNVPVTYNTDFWAKNSASKQLEEAIDSSCWHCPKCNRVNASYVGTCGCGERKPVPNANNTVVTETAQLTTSSQAQSQATTQAVSKAISSTDNQQTTITELQDTEKPRVKNFCPYCGEKVIERQVYCSICGEKLK